MLNTIIKLLIIVVLVQWIYTNAVQTMWVHQDILMELEWRNHVKDLE